MSVSLVLGSREVSVGPTVALQSEVASSVASVVGSGGGATGGSGGPEKQRVTVPCLLGVVQKENMGFASKRSSSSVLNGFARKSFVEESEEEEEEEPSEEDSDDEKVQVKFKGALGSMGSLEESLPIKRGLSNFFSGRSKSFANLSEVTCLTDLAKPENPFNKRRRTLIARSLAIRPIYSSLSLASVPSVLGEEEDEL